MSDYLRTRIANAVWMRHRAEAFAQLGLDALAVPEHPIPNWAYGMADAVIRELRLEALELLARSWYRNYDIIPANDPRCPTDMDIAYDDAGEQILTALGLLHD